MRTVAEFTNPFSDEEDAQLLNISSGVVAPDAIKANLLSAYERGDKRLVEFVNERLVEGEKDLFDQHSLPTGKTFSHIDKKRRASISLQNASVKENRALITMMLMVAQEKGLDIKDV